MLRPYIYETEQGKVNGIAHMSSLVKIEPLARARESGSIA